MEEWKEYKLGDILSVKYGKDHKKIADGSIPIYGSGGIMRFGDRYIFEGPSILIPRKGSLNNIIFADKPFWTVDTMFWTIINQNIANPLFVYYSICKKNFASLNVGSAVPSMTVPVIEDVNIILPPKIIQDKIVSILKSLDDKIECNQRINDNLEQQAQALFKSWFVDFEPFKDGEFVESEMGMIPKNLIVKRVSEIPHTIETGRRPKGGVGEITSGVPSVGAEHVKGLGNYDYSKTKYITEGYAASLKTGKVNGYELLIYKDGGKPGYFIPNYSIFGEGYPFEECFLNEHVFKLDFGDKGYNAFCYFYFWTDYVMNYLNAQGGKAAIPGINRQDIEDILIYSPENEIVKQYGDFVLPLIRQILFNCKESRRLAQLRDTLLPRLMSGELKVNEI